MTRVDQTNEVHQISGELLGAYGKLVIGLAMTLVTGAVAALVLMGWTVGWDATWRLVGQLLRRPFIHPGW